MTTTPRAPEPSQQPEEVYEPPMLVEVGGFAEVTRGTESRPSDYPIYKLGYWLI